MHRASSGPWWMWSWPRWFLYRWRVQLAWRHVPVERRGQIMLKMVERRPPGQPTPDILTMILDQLRP
jgi:hypothetical protein